MIEEPIEIPTPDGLADGFLYRTDDGPPRPGVLHLTDIAGIRPVHRDMARRLAAEGYTVLMPNVFYRTGRPPVIDFSGGFGDERAMKRMEELRAPLTPEAAERDAAAYVACLAGHVSVRAGGLGVVGYCFTGSLAMRTAATRPDRIAACAAFHGGGLCSDAPTSPHRVLPRIKARLYFGHADQDRSMPAEAIAGLGQALDAWGGRYESEVYEGAAHGWTVPGNSIYNQLQAERAYEKLTTLLRETLN
jgi:carboxymethylenebutenolidase